MRNLLFGSIGVLIGLALVIGSLTSGSGTHHAGAYGAGEAAGEVARIPIGVLFLLVGIWAVRKGLQQRRGSS